MSNTKFYVFYVFYMFYVFEKVLELVVASFNNMKSLIEFINHTFIWTLLRIFVLLASLSEVPCNDQ